VLYALNNIETYYKEQKMKKNIIFIFVVLIIGNLFGQDYKTIKEGMPKDQVTELLGNPTKVVTSEDQKTECYIWIANKNAWYVLIQDNKTIGTAVSLEEMIMGILDMFSSVSNMNLFDNNQPESITQQEGLENVTSEEAKETAAKNLIQITTLDSRIIKTWGDKREAGCRFKIKNNSSETIYNLELTIYYYDKNGKVFFENTINPISNSSYSSTIDALKPNYSLMYPADQSNYITASGVDIDEWDEGKITVEIKKISIQSP
jgi:hypothetical protein